MQYFEISSVHCYGRRKSEVDKTPSRVSSYDDTSSKKRGNRSGMIDDSIDGSASETLSFFTISISFSILYHLNMNTILTLDGLVEVCEFGSHGCD